MKKLFILSFVSIGVSLTAQDLFRLQFEAYQYVENKDGALGCYIKLPNQNATIVMGGLNDWDGMNNYFNLFGSKLIIDSTDRSSDGIQKVILRREDGRDFFELFPTVSAKLIPILDVSIDKEDKEPLD